VQEQEEALPPPKISLLPSDLEDSLHPRKETAGDIHTRFLFLTYPHSVVSKQTLGETIVSQVKGIEACVIGEEDHADGTKHLHCILYTEKARNWRFSQLDKWGGKHGDYRRAHGANQLHQARLVGYVTKEDTSPFEYPPGCIAHWQRRLEALKAGTAGSSSGVSLGIYQLLKDGKSVKEVVEAYPQAALIRLRNIQQLDVFLKEAKREEEGRKEWKGLRIRESDDPDFVVPQWAERIVSWFAAAIKQPRQIRDKQLYIKSEPGAGKSTLLAGIMERLRVYIPGEEAFQDGWEDDKYELAVFDEFQGQWNLGFLNKFTDGTQFKTLRKGHGAYEKRQRVPVVICANSDPAELYTTSREAKSVLAFKDRLTIIDVPEEEKIFTYIEIID